jgi:hypothetical protein
MADDKRAREDITLRTSGSENSYLFLRRRLSSVLGRPSFFRSNLHVSF